MLERGVDVLAVSVDPPGVSARLKERLDLDIRFISDPRGILMDGLGIRHKDGLGEHRKAEGKKGRDIFLPTTFLVDRLGTIQWVFRPRTYRVRASIDEITAAIDATIGAKGS